MIGNDESPQWVPGRQSVTLPVVVMRGRAEIRHIVMNESGFRLISQVLFPRGYISRRARDLRFFLLSVLLALAFCGVLAGVVLLLHKQGRV